MNLLENVIECLKDAKIKRDDVTLSSFNHEFQL